MSRKRFSSTLRGGAWAGVDLALLATGCRCVRDQRVWIRVVSEWCAQELKRIRRRTRKKRCQQLYTYQTRLTSEELQQG